MAAGDQYFFNDEQIARLRALYQHFQNESAGTLHQSTRRPLAPARVIVGILTDSITATTALTGKPKVGTLNVYSFSSTGTEDTGIDEKVYNFAPQAATTDRWTVAERCNITGRWVITTQFCS